MARRRRPAAALQGAGLHHPAPEGDPASPSGPRQLYFSLTVKPNKASTTSQSCCFSTNSRREGARRGRTLSLAVFQLDSRSYQTAPLFTLSLAVFQPPTGLAGPQATLSLAVFQLVGFVWFFVFAFDGVPPLLPLN